MSMSIISHILEYEFINEKCSFNLMKKNYSSKNYFYFTNYSDYRREIN